MNQKLATAQKGATYKNCAGIITIPCFSSWFVTGYRNSVYTYTMVGHSPTAGGTTTIPTQVIPLETWLVGPDNTTVMYDFDPQAPMAISRFRRLTTTAADSKDPFSRTTLIPVVAVLRRIPVSTTTPGSVRRSMASRKPIGTPCWALLLADHPLHPGAVLQQRRLDMSVRKRSAVRQR